ncbi:MAG: hypothetical protein IT379_25035 [Deltaproteobacteria bacterium]|nr:hypothetical protein [Deltaproteobacteria bacterium]
MLAIGHVAMGCGDDDGPGTVSFDASPRDSGAEPPDASGQDGAALDSAVDGGATDAATDGASAEGGSGDGGATDGASSAPPAWVTSLERCGNDTDDDGDGIVDGDCRPSFWSGVFVPDLADTVVLDHVASLSGRTQSVLQTYRSTSAVGAERLATDLQRIWDLDAVAHVNLEPSGYSPAQYAASATDPAIGEDLDAVASELASALAARARGRVLLTFGAEMNGDWTDWGCLAVDDFVALYVRAHDAVVSALDASGVDRRRVRWVYGPNSTSSAGCGSAVEYFPGYDRVDYLGMSAYRSEGASVMDAVIRPMKRLSQDIGLMPSWRVDRLIVLQTGTRQVTSDDGDAWTRELFDVATGDPEFLGLIYFNADDWTLFSLATGPRDGFDGWVEAIGGLPQATVGLDGTFTPYFWDVVSSHPRFPEIQSLRAAGHTFGCSTAPPLFCPDDAVTSPQAAALLARAFRLAETDVGPLLCGAASCPDAPITASALASVLATLSGTTVEALSRAGHLDGCDPSTACGDEPVVRADAASWIVHVASVPSASPP